MEKEVEKPKRSRISNPNIRPNVRATSAGTGLRSLEKKNKELSNATKELEEKMKNLKNRTQHRSLPKVRAASAPPRELPTAPRERMRKPASNVSSRLREREAEFQRQVQDREEQINRLKERLKVVSKKLSEAKDGGQVDISKLEKTLQLENGMELQCIIKQVTKERLQLERHLQIANDSLQKNNGVDLQRFLELESTNHHLKQQLDSLDTLQNEHRLVEIQFKEKDEACKELMNTLNFKSALCQDLESQLARVIEKNTELTIANSDLQKKVVELQDVSEECQTLKSTLSLVESECVNAQSEVKNLSGKVRSLENVLDEMHSAAENRREIERQYKEALENLKRKQDEVEDQATKKQADLIDEMKRKIVLLEREKQSQNEKHQELILEMAELKKYGPESISSDMEQPSDNLEIDEIMAKLEQDNKFLADLEKQRAEKKSESPLHRTNSAITDSGFLSQSSLNGSSNSPTSRNNINHSNSNGSLNKIPGVSGDEKINLLGGGGAGLLKAKPHYGSNAMIDKDGSIEIPGKGWCFVYLARYSYDPFQHSPNESPEAELQVNAGDYILVWGDVDEDGFFDGELLDGRRGLVPSNFVGKLEGQDLEDFHQQVILGLGDCDDSVCTSVPHDLDFLSSDEADEKPYKFSQASNHQPFTPMAKKNLPQYASCTDLEATEDEGDGNHNENRIPAPKQLTLEALQNKSLVIGWNPPDYPVNKIDCYQVIVDGIVQSTIRSNERSFKAVVNGVNATIIHRVSVKTIGLNRKTSHEAACTMVIGKDAPLAPTSVKSIRTTSTTSNLTWIPSNSNFMHEICVNNVEVKTVKPGVFRHTLTGLQPNTSYKVTIRAKNIKAAPYISGHNLQSLSSSVEIRTEPKGLPEAPVDIQVDAGPREKTLLVSWLPVTINPSGTSNGAPVTGYVVYADGRRLKDVESGTADQVVIDLDNQFTLSRITVRTKSLDNLSKDSEPCVIPRNLVPTCPPNPSKSAVRNGHHHESDSEDEYLDQISQNTMKIPTLNGYGSKPREVIINYSSGYPELDSDIGPSELSDIAEEPEEGLTDSDSSCCSTPKMKSPIYYKEAKSPISNYKSNYNAPNKWDPTVEKVSTSQYTVSPLSSSQSTFTTSSSVTSTSSSSVQNVQTSKHFTNGKNGTNGTNGFHKPSNHSSSSLYRPTIQISQHDINNTNSNSTMLNGNSHLKPERIRIFVALFDYDPLTMSPNPESAHEELPFREGQLIKIYGEKDPDGFYWGEAANKRGYVPCNMVSEVQVDDEHVAEELFREQSSSSSKANGSANHTTTTKLSASNIDDRWGDIYEDMPAKRKLALYDYDPHELSPNVDSEVELSFRTGDLIFVYGDMDDDGFFMGEIEGKRGLVPSNFLTDVPPGYDPKQLMRIMAQAGPMPVPYSSSSTTSVQIHHPNQPRILGQQKRW